MRGYIFTQIERNIIDAYLNKGVKLGDFYVLLNRIKTNHKRLREDLILMEKILEKESRLD